MYENREQGSVSLACGSKPAKVASSSAVYALIICLSVMPVVAQAGNVVAEAYSSFVTSIAESITNDYQERANTQLETKQIEYNGHLVSYQYLLWRLRPNSVCADQKYDLLTYSRCTKAASALFRETCQHLNANPSNHWKHVKYKQLYCAAALEYRPVIAEAGASKVQNDVDLQRRQQCSALRVEAMRTKDPHTILTRDQVCNGGSR